MVGARSDLLRLIEALVDLKRQGITDAVATRSSITKGIEIDILRSECTSVPYVLVALTDRMRLAHFAYRQLREVEVRDGVTTTVRRRNRIYIMATLAQRFAMETIEVPIAESS